MTTDEFMRTVRDALPGVEWERPELFEAIDVWVVLGAMDGFGIWTVESEPRGWSVTAGSFRASGDTIADAMNALSFNAESALREAASVICAVNPGGLTLSRLADVFHSVKVR